MHFSVAGQSWLGREFLEAHFTSVAFIASMLRYVVLKHLFVRKVFVANGAGVPDVFAVKHCHVTF